MSWSHRLATLEPSPSSSTMSPIDNSIPNNSSLASPFENRLAKYRSLSLLWLRTCTASNRQHRKRRTLSNINKDTTYSLLDQIGEFENNKKETSSQLFTSFCFTFCFFFYPYKFISYMKKRYREQHETFSFSFKRHVRLHILFCLKQKNPLFLYFVFFFLTRSFFNVTYILNACMYVVPVEKKGVYTSNRYEYRSLRAKIK